MAEDPISNTGAAVSVASTCAPAFNNSDVNRPVPAPTSTTRAPWSSTWAAIAGRRLWSTSSARTSSS